MTWIPIIEDSKLSLLALSRIAVEIENDLDKVTDQNLFSGLSGQILLISYSKKYLSEDLFPRIELGNSIEQLIELVNKNTKNGSLAEGLSGTAWVLNHINMLYNKKIDQRVFNQFDEYICQFIYSKIKSDEHDFLLGYIGMMQYILDSETINPKLKRKIALDVFNRLKETALEVNGGIAWINPVKIAEYSSEKSFDCNLGMAHGMPGIISFLIELYPLLQDKEAVISIINKALGFFLNQMQLNEDGFYFKNYNDDAEKYLFSRLSWCYGDLGISLMFLKLFKLTSNVYFQEIGITLAQNTLKLSFEKTQVEEGSLCHGAVGAAHLYNRIYQQTNMQIFKDASLKWYQTLFDLYYEAHGGMFLRPYYGGQARPSKYIKDNGLFFGTSGIALSLISAITYHEPKWDHRLLLI